MSTPTYEPEYEDFPANDEYEWLDGCRTRMEKIKATINVPRIGDDAHWDPSGRPSIKAVEKLSKLEGITRKEISRAAPYYDRFVAESYWIVVSYLANLEALGKKSSKLVKAR